MLVWVFLLSWRSRTVAPSGVSFLPLQIQSLGRAFLPCMTVLWPLVKSMPNRGSTIVKDGSSSCSARSACKSPHSFPECPITLA